MRRSCIGCSIIILLLVNLWLAISSIIQSVQNFAIIWIVSFIIHVANTVVIYLLLRQLMRSGLFKRGEEEEDEDEDEDVEEEDEEEGEDEGTKKGEEAEESKESWGSPFT